jgi:hypothetical protein
MYAKLENDSITETTWVLPSKLPDGRTRSNVHKQPPEGWVKVVEADKPNYDSETQYLAYGDVTLVKGVPTQQWVVKDVEADEVDV